MSFKKKIINGLEIIAICGISMVLAGICWIVFNAMVPSEQPLNIVVYLIGLLTILLGIGITGGCILLISYVGKH